MLGPFLPTLLLLSPFGWAGRATIHAGAGDLRTSAPWAILAILFIAATVAAALALLNRILAGDGVAPGVSARARPRRARVLLPGVLGAMIETQLRTQLRTPAARMALITPMLMMGLFTWSFTRRTGASFNPAVMVAILCLVGPSALLTVGRGVTLVLGTPASRAAMLMASDVSSLLFRLPPILAIVGVTAWRLGASSAIAISALGIVLLTVSSGVQHFPAILSPVALPRDRLNPFAQRTDARQAGNQVRSFLALFLAVTLSAPFAFLLWLGPRVVNGSFAFAVTTLAIVGAFATYAVLIALAERLLIRRERAVLEVLLDDASG